MNNSLNLNATNTNLSQLNTVGGVATSTTPPNLMNSTISRPQNQLGNSNQQSESIILLLLFFYIFLNASLAMVIKSRI